MAVYLARNGVPYDRAMDMEMSDLIAHAVVLGQQDGGKFDWESLGWIKEE